MTTPSLTRPSTFPEQAAQRVHLYADALAALGVTSATPLRFLAVLTTDLPGEVIEVAVTDHTGAATVHRVRPSGPMSPGAQRHHGISLDDLQHEPPLSDVLPGVLAALGTSMNPPPVIIAWAGQFVRDAIIASAPGADLPTWIDLQDLVYRQDLRLNELLRYRPSLAGMAYTVQTPPIDPTSALSAAQALSAVTGGITHRHAIDTPPTRQTR